VIRKLLVVERVDGRRVVALLVTWEVPVVEPVHEESERRGLNFFQCYCFLLSFFEAACQSGAKELGVVGEEALMNHEPCLLGANNDCGKGRTWGSLEHSVTCTIRKVLHLRKRWVRALGTAARLWCVGRHSR
jgi:hypothetical protein